MSEFKKWFEDYEDKFEINAEILCKDAFEAGQQSQQAKIDGLQGRIDSLTNINESLVAYKNQLLDEIEGNKDEY